MSTEIEKKTRVKTVVPETGTYTVVATRLKADDSARGKVVQTMMDCDNFEAFFQNAPATFIQVNKNEEAVEKSTKGFVAYCIKRGMITVD
jgi:hypothetical protein